MQRINLFLFILLSNYFFSQEAFIDNTVYSGIDHTYDVYQGLFGGGVAVFDYDNDGFEDLFITGGQSNDKLYRNIGNGKFEDIAYEAGIQKEKNIITTGVTTSDVNKDGLVDIFVTTFASDQILSLIHISEPTRPY